jgi:hypothetical protein
MKKTHLLINPVLNSQQLPSKRAKQSTLETPNFRDGGSGAGHSKGEWQTEAMACIQALKLATDSGVRRIVTGTDTTNLKTAL